jgi:hypothetical protein
MLAATRAVCRGLSAARKGASSVRGRVLERAAAVGADPRWPRLFDGCERKLSAWHIACALFVALILALGAAVSA